MQMKRSFSLMAMLAASLVQGCTTFPQHAAMLTASGAEPGVAQSSACGPASVDRCSDAMAASTNTVSAVALCAAPGGCGEHDSAIADGAAIGIERNAPLVEGHPLTSVVVTQCNMVVAVYMTMPDGRFLRFDRTANVPADQLVATAYTATRSERVEVSCDAVGVTGYETHDPI
jgi:hypothetical protein